MKKGWIIFMGVFLIISYSHEVRSMERFDIYTTEEMGQLLIDRDAGKIDFVLVNTLDEVLYRHSAIPNSINIPWNRIEDKAYSSQIIQTLGDKDRLIITY